jgi:hypothetical protein
MNMSARRCIPSFLIAVFSIALLVFGGATAAADEVYGPVNLVKTLPTPFGSSNGDTGSSEKALAPMTIHSAAARSLSSRLLPSRLYLPGRMVIGSTCEFIIKGKPGSWAALAMADRDSGAKPVYGHALHLGADRKVVSVGQIPESGVLSLVIDTPIQGDLIGQPWYFEAAIWARPDFSDLEMATPVPSETTGLGGFNNGVLVAGEPDKKRGIRIVPDATMQMQQVQGKTSLDSGRP